METIVPKIFELTANTNPEIINLFIVFAFTYCTFAFIRSYQDIHNNLFFSRGLKKLEMLESINMPEKLAKIHKSKKDKEIFFHLTQIKTNTKNREFLIKLYETDSFTTKQLKEFMPYIHDNNGKLMLRIGLLDKILALTGMIMATLLMLYGLFLYINIANMDFAFSFLLALCVLITFGLFGIPFLKEWFVQARLRKSKHIFDNIEVSFSEKNILKKAKDIKNNEQ